MIYSAIEIGLFLETSVGQIDESCRNYFATLRPFLQTTFVFVQMYFIFLNQKVMNDMNCLHLVSYLLNLQLLFVWNICCQPYSFNIINNRCLNQAFIFLCTCFNSRWTFTGGNWSPGLAWCTWLPPISVYGWVSSSWRPLMRLRPPKSPRPIRATVSRLVRPRQGFKLVAIIHLINLPQRNTVKILDLSHYSGQIACLLLRRSQFESCWSQQFVEYLLCLWNIYLSPIVGIPN